MKISIKRMRIISIAVIFCLLFTVSCKKNQVTSPQGHSLTVTVIDAAAWTPEATQGARVNGATVSLYNSQAQYGAGKPPVYNATTDANGDVLFQKVTAGTYLIVAEKGDESNILKEPGFWIGTPVNYHNTLIYTGLAIRSIFQSQAEVTTSPKQPNAAPGNFQYVDANHDGVINEADFVPSPGRFRSIQPSAR